MASIYRRKQDAILGLDNCSFVATSDTLANAVARYRGEPGGRRNEDYEEETSDRIANSRDYARSYYEHSIDEDYEVSDLEDSDEDERLRGRRPSKADYILGRDTTKTSGISSKAQKLLGISENVETVPEPRSPIRQHTTRTISPDRESIAPKALRTLGIGSKHETRPVAAHERSPKHAGPFEPDEFKRMLSFSARPVHADNHSSTDVSSQLSRESTISWRTETPRSSQEVHLEDLRWRDSRSTAFTKRKDSLFDPNAILTEPFSPLNVRTSLSKSFPKPPNEFSFELPGDAPVGYYGSEKNAFIAELPEASPPLVYEMPAHVPDVVELPGDLLSEAPSGERRADLSTSYPHVAELYSGSPPKAPIPHTAAAGELSPSKAYLNLQRNVMVPSARAVSVPRSSFGGPSITTNPAQEMRRRPTVHGLQTDAIARVRSEEGFARSRAVNGVTKARSTEFVVPSQFIPQTPISPTSPSSGLGAIAAKAGTARRRQDGSTGSKPTLARSKFNPEVQVGRRDTGMRPQLPVEQATISDHDDEDETPIPESAVRREAVNDEYPDSPVTGYLAGHPAFNKPLPIPESGKDKTVLELAEMPAQVNAAAAEIPPALDPKSFTVANLKKQGLI